MGEKERELLLLLPEVLVRQAPRFEMALDEVLLTVEASRLLEVSQILKDDSRFAFDFLRCLSVVDYKEYIQVVYHLWSMKNCHKLVVKVDVPSDAPKLPSIVSVWKGADWFEREGAELYGVQFQGHPSPLPLLLWEGFEGYPGLKSFPFHEYEEY